MSENFGPMPGFFPQDIQVIREGDAGGLGIAEDGPADDHPLVPEGHRVEIEPLRNGRPEVLEEFRDHEVGRSKIPDFLKLEPSRP